MVISASKGDLKALKAADLASEKREMQFSN